MRPVHPGEILSEELEARRLSANALAIAPRTPSGRVTDILNGKRGVSPENAMLLPAISEIARVSGSICKRPTSSPSPGRNSASGSGRK
jgi:hypothetical protein